MKKREAELLPCDYFHVVATVPAELRSLFLREQKFFYGLLMSTCIGIDDLSTARPLLPQPKSFGPAQAPCLPAFLVRQPRCERKNSLHSCKETALKPPAVPTPPAKPATSARKCCSTKQIMSKANCQRPQIAERSSTALKSLSRITKLSTLFF